MRNTVLDNKQLGHDLELLFRLSSSLFFRKFTKEVAAGDRVLEVK
jgi:hypothetical protein